MKKQWIALIGSGAVIIGLATAGVGFANAEREQRVTGTIPVADQAEAAYPGMAKISLDQAVKDAVAAVPGRVLRVELEGEDGFLVYGIEVVGQDQTVTDLKIDAGSGKVLARHKDTADRHEHNGEGREHDEREGHEGEE
jgi:hypothetical protein